MTYPLKITDDLLFSQEEPHVRVVLAATFGYGKRNPSLTQLAQATGLKRHTIRDAQDRVDRMNINPCWIEDGSLPVFLERPRGFYDRPAEFFDRNPDNRRFNRSNTLTAVVPRYDPDIAPNYVILPGVVVERLPRGTKNAAVIRLVALTYAREQLLTGAVQREDEAVAEMLHLYVIRNGVWEETNVRQVERARKALLKA